MAFCCGFWRFRHSPFSQISGHPPLFATPFIDYLRSGSRLSGAAGLRGDHLRLGVTRAPRVWCNRGPTSKTAWSYPRCVGRVVPPLCSCGFRCRCGTKRSPAGDSSRVGVHRRRRAAGGVERRSRRVGLGDGHGFRTGGGNSSPNISPEVRTPAGRRRSPALRPAYRWTGRSGSPGPGWGPFAEPRLMTVHCCDDQQRRP